MTFYELAVMECLCEPERFTVNGIDADYNDFGVKSDNGEDAEDYCCADMEFVGRLIPDKGVLEKYKIDIVQYNTIAMDLESKLSFGACGWCS